MEYTGNKRKAIGSTAVDVDTNAFVAAIKTAVAPEASVASSAPAQVQNTAVAIQLDTIAASLQEGQILRPLEIGLDAIRDLLDSLHARMDSSAAHLVGIDQRLHSQGQTCTELQRAVSEIVLRTGRDTLVPRDDDAGSVAARLRVELDRYKEEVDRARGRERDAELRAVTAEERLTHWMDMSHRLEARVSERDTEIGRLNSLLESTLSENTQLQSRLDRIVSAAGVAGATDPRKLPSLATDPPSARRDPFSSGPGTDRNVRSPSSSTAISLDPRAATAAAPVRNPSTTATIGAPGVYIHGGSAQLAGKPVTSAGGSAYWSGPSVPLHPHDTNIMK
jgi:hypothetical protein